MNEMSKLELFIAKMLRRGVLLAGVLVALGWLLQIDFQRNIFVEYSSYQEADFLETLGSLYSDRMWGLLIIYLGLFVLISLPFIRVLLTGVLFLKQKDYAMGGIVLFVLSGLVLSLILGFEI